MPAKSAVKQYSFEMDGLSTPDEVVTAKPTPVLNSSIRAADPIIIDADEGHIKVRRKQRVPTLKELVAKITPDNRYQEIPAGPARGKESVEW